MTTAQSTKQALLTGDRDRRLEVWGLGATWPSPAEQILGDGYAAVTFLTACCTKAVGMIETSRSSKIMGNETADAFGAPHLSPLAQTEDLV